MLLSLPLELIQKIAVELHDDPGSPPAPLLPLLLTCRHLHNLLSFTSNSHLYFRLFHLAFDASAPARRLGSLDAVGLSNQFRENYSALKVIRRRNVHADNILETFWTAFFMLLENDGKNRCQLDAAGLHEFVDTFIRERLYENNIKGWPVENEINSLALWLLWLSSTEDRLKAQTSQQRAQMTRLILPFVLMPIRYPAAIAPHIHYNLPLPANVLPRQLHSFITVHGPYPQYRRGFYRKMSLYHVDRMKLGFPLASIAAKLLYFSHREVFPVAVPPHLPRTREHANQLGLYNVGPTQEDVRELNEHKVAKFAPQTNWEWWNNISGYDNLTSEARSKLAPSVRWDDDWNRLADCNSIFTPVSLKRTHYTPGLLCGLWQGRMLHPDDNLYGNVMQMPHMPTNFNEQLVGLTAAPVFMRLREYHCMDVAPNQPVQAGSIQNAWFPSSARFVELPHALGITCQDMSSTYKEYVVDGPDLHDESRCHGCQYRGTSEMIFRADDARYLAEVDAALADDGQEASEDDDDDDDETMDDDSSDPDVDMASTSGDEFMIKRKCNGILDIVLVGETDPQHSQAWHQYKFYGRIREWDGLVALVRIPTHPHLGAALGIWVFTGYVVGGHNFVGNWRMTSHPDEPVTIEGAFAMSKRE